MRDDEVELDIELDPDGRAPVQDDAAGERGDRPRWQPVLPWVAVALGIGAVGVVLAGRIPPPLGDVPGVVADQSVAPEQAWMAEVCAPDAEIVLTDDTVLVVARTCVQAVDPDTGEERWRLEVPGLVCHPARADVLACLEGEGKEQRLVTVDIASGRVSERDVRGLVDALAAGDDVIESTLAGDGISLRRVAPDGSEVWAATLPADAEIRESDAARVYGFGPIVGVWGSSETLGMADGARLPEISAADLSARYVALGPADAERPVYRVDGLLIGTLAPGQMLPGVSDDLDPDVVLIADPSNPMYGTDLNVVARDRTGHDLWEAPRGMWPLAVVDGVVVFVPFSYENVAEIVAYDLMSGVELWRADSNLGFSRLWTDGTRILVTQFAQDGAWLAALNVRTGVEEWRVDVHGPDGGGILDVLPDGTAIVLTPEGLAGWRAP
ncbi:hypothetical protein Bcav_2124 [Beutenbergia cavernae DSM 12333]|uniref:Pyrrolo-quinoline quinone repeat domain-containing protein n=1 Tax=Beutenbergia cavernae (strain ATCC BAA-8 / DSM 12333 / CCUG 43141 / JCM 11478 / NBRC 16432 / NCIMB 13614 / HKI 0122) TaxID=471853 RepID=C5C6H0_BEUC1|nr:PQQ-binding-like beta-propeller repeat protein [Beutenbergia cavernae]ACQ80376.1 hypothetical protein Bcav_2124 [Beutenbergia cavernae DSM 12333]